jgi:hypothetical protein
MSKFFNLAALMPSRLKSLTSAGLLFWGMATSHLNAQNCGNYQTDYINAYNLWGSAADLLSIPPTTYGYWSTQTANANLYIQTATAQIVRLNQLLNNSMIPSANVGCINSTISYYQGVIKYANLFLTTYPTSPAQPLTTAAPTQAKPLSSTDVDNDIAQAGKYRTYAQNLAGSDPVSAGNAANISMSYLNAGMAYKAKTSQQVYEMQQINVDLSNLLTTLSFNKPTVYGMSFSATSAATTPTTQRPVSSTTTAKATLTPPTTSMPTKGFRR